MTSLAAGIHREMVRGLVAKAITCPRTGEVLDVRTCVVLKDSDGDPAVVLSQAGWKAVVTEGGDALLKKTHGLTADPTTVKGA